MKLLIYFLGASLFYTQSTFAQQQNPPNNIDITGKVTNNKGEALANANVTIKGGRGTITNAQGQFLLRKVPSNSILEISFIGYTTQLVQVKGRSNLECVLLAAENTLDRVVIQGYGITSDRLRTGSITRVTSEEISKQPVMNVLQVLQGQTPGTVVTNASGYASGTVKIEVRGRNTINSNFPSDPLIIIDGVPLTILDINGSDSYAGGSQGVIRSGIFSPASGESPLFGINPSDIENIEILKDADATAIYGSRASNGVILITTKRGSPGKTNFDLNVYQGISKITTRYDVLNTQQYVEMRKEALANDGLPLSLSRAPDLVAWDTTRYTDWQKFLFGGTGKVTDVQGTLSGGNPQTSFRIGAGYRYQRDILAVSGGNKRGSMSLNLNHKSANQRLAIAVTAQYNNTSIDIISNPSAALLAPNAPAVYDTRGQLNYDGWAPLSFNYPFASLFRPYLSKSNFLNGSMDLSYEITKGLLIRSNLGYSNIQNEQKNLITIASQNPQFNPLGEAYFGNSFVRNWIIEPQMEYNTFIKESKMQLLFGASLQSNGTSSIFASGTGYTNDVLMSSTNNAPTKFVINNNGDYKYAALFGRINYNLKNKYIVNLNVRRDGSSRFGPGRQYGSFGSIGAAWIFSEANWIKRNLDFLSFGKIRASYGLTGGDQIADYSFLSQWTFPNSLYNGSIPLVATRHTDSLLQWQVNKKFEISFNLGFFNDRFNIEANWYQNRCNNQLVQFPTPSLTGFTDVVSNSPANIQNRGYELLFSGKVLENRSLKWEVKFNLSSNRNKLISYPNFSQSPYVSQYTIGKSLNIVKVLHYTGVSPQDGLYQFDDKNKDGSITVDVSGATNDDRYDLDISPKFYGGFSNTFSYKNFDLSFLFYFKKQIGINAFAVSSAGGTMQNQPKEVYLNHWQKPGDIAQYAKFTTRPSSNNSYINFFFFSDGKYTDASFIRLQNLTLSYSTPEKVNKKIGLQTSKIYVKCQNMLLITRYKGSDSELQVFGGLPLAKIITIGLNCNF